uniref:TANC1/2-like winged helix domain-containing protein n=1 Tax=Petromyzon marinus TaxID=7757 RepID=S4REA0_PETMA
MVVVTAQGKSPPSAVTSGSASPHAASPCHSPAREGAVPPGELSPAHLLPTPSSTLESQDSGIIATITRSGGSLEQMEEGSPPDDMAEFGQPESSGAAAYAEKGNIAAQQEATAAARRLSQSADQGLDVPPPPTARRSPSLLAPRPNSIAASSLARLEDLGPLDEPRGEPLHASMRTPLHSRAPARLPSCKPVDAALKPLPFELPSVAGEVSFVGREWLFRELELRLGGRVSGGGSGRSSIGGSGGVFIVGGVGSGKTAIVARLVRLSCHGETAASRSNSSYNPAQHLRSDDPARRLAAKERLLVLSASTVTMPQDRSRIKKGKPRCEMGPAADPSRCTVFQVVAYHYCQSDRASTCLVPEFVHSVAALLCRAPQLAVYRELVARSPELQTALSMRSCVQEPGAALRLGVLQPLSTLRKDGKLADRDMLLLVDGLHEAEFHKPDHGDTIASFLAVHLAAFPPRLKLVLTVRTASQVRPMARSAPPTQLEGRGSGKRVDISGRDSFVLSPFSTKLFRERSFRMQCISKRGVALSLVPMIKYLCKWLFVLVRTPRLNIRPCARFQELPCSLSELFELQCNALFPKRADFMRVLPLLNVALASLQPLSEAQLLQALRAGHVGLPPPGSPAADFPAVLEKVSPLLPRLADGTRMFRHPALREWLAWRQDGKSKRFLCEPRSGHALLAMALSRQGGTLSPEQTLELGHHILKAHIYKGLSKRPGISSSVLQALWVAHSTDGLSAALTSLRNLYTPNIKV